MEFEQPRGGSRGRVKGVPPRDDLRLSNTTGILQKDKYKSAMPFLTVAPPPPPPKKNPGSDPATSVEMKMNYC